MKLWSIRRRVLVACVAVCLLVSVLAPRRSDAAGPALAVPWIVITVGEWTGAWTAAQVTGAVATIAGHAALAWALWWGATDRNSANVPPVTTHINMSTTQNKPPNDPRFDCLGGGANKDYVPCPNYNKSNEADASAAGFSTNEQVVSAMGGWGAGKTFKLLDSGPPAVLYSYVMTAAEKVSICPQQVAYPGPPWQIMLGSEGGTQCFSLWRKAEALADVPCRDGYSVNPSNANNCVKTSSPKKDPTNPCETRFNGTTHEKDAYSSNCDGDVHTDENGNPVPTSISGGDKTQENADGSVRQRVHQNADGSGNIVVVTFDDPSNANSGYGWTTVWFGPPDATGRNPVTGAQSGTSPTPPPTGMPTSPIGRPAGTGSNPGTGTGTGGTGAGTGTGTSSGTGSCGGTGQAACNTEIDDSAFAGQLAVVSGAASSAVSAANGTGALDQISQIKNGTLISIATDWIPSFKPGPAFSCQDISWQVAISHGPLAGISATKNISFCDKLSSIRDFLSWVIWFGTAIGLVRLFFATVGAYPQHQYGSFR